MYVNKLSPEYDNILSMYGETSTLEDLDTYEKRYRLYEYTDDIYVLEDNPLYPGLINYVKTGLLTEEEMIRALIHED